MNPFKLTIKDFSGGVNLKYDDDQMAINEAKEAINVDPKSKGWLDRRHGCTNFTTDGIGSEVSVDNMIRFYPDSSTKILVASTNNATANKIWKFSDSTGAETEITGGTALSANARIRFAIYKGNLFLTDGSHVIQYWTGSGNKADISGTPTPPTGKYITVHKRRLYVAGNATYPAHLYYSGLGLYTALPTTDFPADNDEPIGDETKAITGIIAQQDHLVIFKDNTFHKWIGVADYDFRVLDTNRPYGCIAPDSLAMCEGWVVFLAHDGVRAYDGGLHAVLLSDKITPAIEGSSTMFGMNQSYRDKAFGLYHDGLYHLYYRGVGSSYNNLEMIFNFRSWLESNGQKYSWYFNTSRNINCGCVYSGGSDQNQLYVGDSNAPYIYHDESGYTDNIYGAGSTGNVIDVYWKSKKIDTFEGAVSHQVKKWRKLKMNTYLQGGSFEIYYDVDNQRTSSSTVTQTVSGQLWGDGSYWKASANDYWTNDVLRDVNLGLSEGLVGKNISLLIREKTSRNMSKVFNIELYGKAKPYK